MEKPLFIPLKAEYYEDFNRGTKTFEFRLEGPRWNNKTCYKGRQVILSKGYGKKHRLKGVIVNTYIEYNCVVINFVRIYGKNQTCRVIDIEIERLENA
jgi:hypothetical protein